MADSFNDEIPLKDIEDPKDLEIARLCFLCIDLQNQLNMAEMVADSATSLAEEYRVKMQEVIDQRNEDLMQASRETAHEWEQKRHLQVLVINLVNTLLRIKQEMIENLTEFSSN